LIDVGLAKDRVQRRDNGHLKVALELLKVSAGRTAEDSVLMLETNQIDVAEIQEVRCLPV